LHYLASGLAINHKKFCIGHNQGLMQQPVKPGSSEDWSVRLTNNGVFRILWGGSTEGTRSRCYFVQNFLCSGKRGRDCPVAHLNTPLPTDITASQLNWTQFWQFWQRALYSECYKHCSV